MPSQNPAWHEVGKSELQVLRYDGSGFVPQTFDSETQQFIDDPTMEVVEVSEFKEGDSAGTRYLAKCRIREKKKTNE